MRDELVEFALRDLSVVTLPLSLLLACVSALKFSLVDGQIPVNLLCSQLLELKFGVVVALRGTAVN